MFFQEFFLRWGGGGGAVRVEGGLSLIAGCFLDGPKVFFLKNTAYWVKYLGVAAMRIDDSSTLLVWH